MDAADTIFIILLIVIYLNCRVDNFKSRCSIAKADIFTDTTDEEVLDNFESADYNCTVPVVHLKSDILDSEALDLLAKGTYVDTILTTLPVSSLLSIVYYITSIISHSLSDK